MRQEAPHPITQANVTTAAQRLIDGADQPPWRPAIPGKIRPTPNTFQSIAKHATGRADVSVNFLDRLGPIKHRREFVRAMGQEIRIHLLGITRISVIV